MWDNFFSECQASALLHQVFTSPSQKHQVSCSQSADFALLFSTDRLFDDLFQAEAATHQEHRYDSGHPVSLEITLGNPRACFVVPPPPHTPGRWWRENLVLHTLINDMKSHMLQPTQSVTNWMKVITVSSQPFTTDTPPREQRAHDS